MNGPTSEFWKMGDPETLAIFFLLSGTQALFGLVRLHHVRNLASIGSSIREAITAFDILTIVCFAIILAISVIGITTPVLSTNL